MKTQASTRATLLLIMPDRKTAFEVCPHSWQATGFDGDGGTITARFARRPTPLNLRALRKRLRALTAGKP